MARNKRARVEGDGVEGRTGVMKRKPWVVEARLPINVADLKLQGGSYETEEEANVGRDFISYVRNSTGQEDCATVGGFEPDVHPSIFKYQESPEIFESLEGSDSRVRARCDQYKSLLERPTKEACKKFCEAIREDIALAIKFFRSRYPQKFPRPPLSNRLPYAEPVDGETHRTPPPSSSEARVSPTVGASMGEGSTGFIGAESLKVQITVNGFLHQTLMFKNSPPITVEEMARSTKVAKDEMERNLRELVDKLLLELDPCSIDPETIPALE